ncbi:flavoprotein [Streptomyces sp. M54]|uniref:flavoprotein n=1 Tax=Streptomyces sp. M54 TaxID=2759525 RepID=UPI001A8BFD0C|nr:flavoprotein [Streptomyces sp. M54]QSS91733.1 flavoprotein [Streptomyces sp. M54]
MREPSGSRGRKPFLYVVVCAAGVARDADVLFAAAQDAGWDVGVVATPQGLGFLDAAAVEARTGYPVRSAWRSPGEPRPFPDPDAIAVAPATFNTVNKWAAGIADTLALGILCEAYGQGVPTAVLPAVNSFLARHPAYAESLARLRAMGVRVSSATPHTPKSGGTAAFPWEEALELLAPEHAE